MSPLVVKPVRGWWDRRRFLRLPWLLHKKDPNWVPPLRHNQKQLVGYGSHPFYREAEAQTFLAVRRGKPCGRIVAILEIVSPGNKDSRAALRDFIEKTIDFLRAGIHVLIVYLFPPTPRDPFGIHKAIWDEIEEEDFSFPWGKTGSWCRIRPAESASPTSSL